MDGTYTSTTPKPSPLVNGGQHWPSKVDMQHTARTLPITVPAAQTTLPCVAAGCRAMLASVVRSSHCTTVEEGEAPGMDSEPTGANANPACPHRTRTVWVLFRDRPAVMKMSTVSAGARPLASASGVSVGAAPSGPGLSGLGAGVAVAASARTHASNAGSNKHGPAG